MADENQSLFPGEDTRPPLTLDDTVVYPEETKAPVQVDAAPFVPALSGAAQALTGETIDPPVPEPVDERLSYTDPRIDLDLKGLYNEGFTIGQIIRSKSVQNEVLNTPGLGFDVQGMIDDPDISDVEISRRIFRTRSGYYDEEGNYIQTQSPVSLGAEMVGRGVVRTAPSLALGAAGAIAGAKIGAVAAPFTGPFAPVTPIVLTLGGFLTGTIAGVVTGSSLEKMLLPTVPYDPTLVSPAVLSGFEILGEGLGYIAAPYMLTRKPLEMGARHLMDAWGDHASRVLRSTAKGSDLLKSLLQSIGTSAATRPVAVAWGETASVAGSAVVGAGLEASQISNLQQGMWGSPMAGRITGEVLGGIFSPFWLIGNGGITIVDGIRRLVRSWRPGGRITNAGAKLIKMMEAIEPVVDADGRVIRDMSDPRAWLKQLDEKDFLETLSEEFGLSVDPKQMDPATVLPAEAAALLVNARRTLARQMGDQQKADEVVAGMKKDLLSMQTLVNLMGGTDDPAILAARAALEQEIYKSIIAGDFSRRLSEAAEAGDRLMFPGGKPTDESLTAREEFPTPIVARARASLEAASTQATQDLKDTVSAGRGSWRKTEGIYFDEAATLAAESGVTVRATNTSNAVDELIAQGVPTDSGIPTSIINLVDSVRPQVAETAAALKAAVTEGGNLALTGKTTTYIKYGEVVKKRQTILNEASGATKKSSATVTRLQGEVERLEGHQGAPLKEARHQIGLALAEDMEGATPASVKALNTRGVEGDFQDWRAFSKDTHSDEANAAANTGWANFNDLRTKGWGQGQKQDNALKRSIAALERIAAEAGGKGTGRFSVTGGTWNRNWGYDDAGSEIRKATKELANNQIALLRAQRKLLAAQKKSTKLQADTPKTVVQAQNQLDKLRADIAANKQAQLDFRTAPEALPDTVPELSIMEMQRMRSDILKHLRASRKDVVGNANQVRALGKLERALLDDMAETTSESVLKGLPPPERMAARKAWMAIQKAVAWSRAGNDVYTRAYKIRELTAKDEFGAEVLPPELYEWDLFNNPPSETTLAMDAVTRAGVGLVEGNNAMARGDRFVSVRSAQVNLMRNIASRFVNSETGLPNQGDIADFLVSHASLLRFFPDIRNDLESAQMAKARFADAQDPTSALTKAEENSLALASFLGADSSPGTVIATGIGDPGKRTPGSVSWFRKTMKEAVETGDPRVREGFSQAVFDAAWNYAGGNSNGPFSFKMMADYLYTPLGGRRGGPSPLQIMRKEGLLSDPQVLRLDSLVAKSSKIEAEIADYVNKFEELLSRGVNLENLTGKQLVEELDLIPRRIDKPGWVLGDPVQGASWRATRKIREQEGVMLDNPGILARFMVRVLGSRIGAATGTGIKKIFGITGEGSQLQAAAAGAAAMDSAVNRTPLSAYQNIIWEALNDRELFRTLIAKGMDAKSKFRIAKNYVAALGAAGITVADPAPDVYRESTTEERQGKRDLYRSFSPGRSSRPRDPWRSTFTFPGTIGPAEGDKPFPGLLAPAIQPNVAPSPVALPPAAAPAPSPQANAQRQRFKAQYPFDFGMELVPPAQPAAQQPAAPPRFQAGFAAGGPVKRKRPGILGLA
jgi:hypothetical protein